MNKLEFYILRIFQDMMIKNQNETRYLTLDSNLLALIKGDKELDLYVNTELVLEGRMLDSFSFSKVVEGLYKLNWSDQFLYLIGEKSKVDIHPSVITKELELLKVSSNPLTNYIKTL
jgi:hypothetical protein